MIGFIGLGNMGRGMAANLVRRSSDEVLVFDINHQAVAALVEVGAKAARGVAEVARDCDLIFLSLPGPTEVGEVILGRDGILENSRQGTTIFDTSTNSLTLQRQLKETLGEHGVDLLDAPVSGGVAGSVSGDMAIWVGGEKTVFERHLPVLRTFSDHPQYVGAFGSGTLTKVSHNMIGYMILLSLTETFSMAVKAGADPLGLWKSLRTGVMGRRSPLDLLVGQFLPGEYENREMSLTIARKDMLMGATLGRELGVSMRLADLTLSEMTEALGRGLGDEDARAYLKLQLERAGVEIAVDRVDLAAAVAAIQNVR
ncbi:3-hydroxyisobutyrate dehydrogenase [Rhodococcus sp. 27YEA15]|uniref:NAD(P)-dependent oxidoreductase n=1 Tax=Rhodococcus sp. 27YEA15 TaxID=3156259 RepID=UPI003C79D70A